MKKVVIILSLVLAFLKLPSTEMHIKFLFVQSITRESTPLTMENVIHELIRNDIQHIDVVVRQIMWETGHLKSRRAVEDHNLFGFTAKKGMKFKTWEDSVKYYKLWQDRKYRGGDYYSFLKTVRYAEDENYIKNLQSLSTKKFAKFYIT